MIVYSICILILTKKQGGDVNFYAYRVGARTEVDEVPERLEPDPALGQRVCGGVDLPDLDHPLGAELDGLPCALGRLPQLAHDEHGGAGGREPRDRVHGGVDDDLQRPEAGPVGDLEEGERAAALLPAGPDPAAHDNALAEEGRAPGQDVADAGAGDRGLQVGG